MVLMVAGSCLPIHSENTVQILPYITRQIPIFDLQSKPFQPSCLPPPLLSLPLAVVVREVVSVPRYVRQRHLVEGQFAVSYADQVCTTGSNLLLRQAARPPLHLREGIYREQDYRRKVLMQ